MTLKYVKLLTASPRLTFASTKLIELILAATTLKIKNEIAVSFPLYLHHCHVQLFTTIVCKRQPGQVYTNRHAAMANSRRSRVHCKRWQGGMDERLWRKGMEQD
jgi:hypothetical protein